MSTKCFTRMGQIGIAVKDIERAKDICHGYGMGPLRYFDANEQSVQHCELYGKKVDRILFGNYMYEMQGVTFELVSDIENTVWKRFIEEQGEGICDVMFTPTPRYYEVLAERGVQEVMKFTLYNYKFAEDDIFDQVMRMHDTRKDLGFNIFTWDQTEAAKKRVYPRDQMATGWYHMLDDGTEPFLQAPQFDRLERILEVVENLEETIENYKAYGFGPFTEIQDYGRYRSASFAQTTDFEDVIFEIIEPIDPQCAYAKYLAKYGRGIYNILFRQNPEYNNIIKTMTQEI